LKWAIRTFQPYKSPDPDGIQPILLQSQLATPITNILISSLALGHIPTAWSIAKVVFIPKARKKDITDPKSFRPIIGSDIVFAKNVGKASGCQHLKLHIQSRSFRHSQSMPIHFQKSW